MIRILLAIFLAPTLALAQPVIFSGNAVKTLKPNINIDDIAYLLTGTADPSVVPVRAPKGSMYLMVGTSGGRVFVKQDTSILPTTNWTEVGTGNPGTITSVGLSLPGIFSVSNSPVTTSGTLTGTLVSQIANSVWAGPASGSNAPPTFRALVENDIPTLSYVKIGGGATLSTSTTGVTVGGGAGAVVSPATINIATSTGSTTGLLTAADWTTFNAKTTATTATDENICRFDGTSGSIQTSNLHLSSDNIIQPSSANASFSLLGGPATSGTSGALTLSSGLNTGSGNTGNTVLMTALPTSGTRGLIKIVDGTEGTSGNIWTSVDAFGGGHWAPSPSGVDTAIADFQYSNLWQSYWGTISLPAIVVAGNNSEVNAAFGAGIIYDGPGGSNEFLIGTSEQSSTTQTAQVEIRSGKQTGTGNTGNVYIAPGDAVGGTAGFLTLSVGSSASGTGAVEVYVPQARFNIVSPNLGLVDAGAVWTLTNDATGEGDWATMPTSANISLSNLAATTAINSDITFAANTSRSVIIPQRTVSTTVGNDLTVSAGAALGSVTLGTEGGVLYLRAGQSSEGFGASEYQVGAPIIFQTTGAPYGQAASTSLNPYIDYMTITPTAFSRGNFTFGNQSTDYMKMWLADSSSGAQQMQFRSPGFSSALYISGPNRSAGNGAGSGPLTSLAAGDAYVSGLGGILTLTGGTAAGTDQTGGTAYLIGGVATGNGGSSVVIGAAASGQGAGSTPRQAAPVATFSGDTVTLQTPLHFGAGIAGLLKTVNASGATQDMTIKSGDSVSGAAGAVILQAGNSAANTDSGFLYGHTGNAGGSGKSGYIKWLTGDASSGDSGDIVLQIGTSGATRGKIKFVDGTEGTAGYSWRSTSTGGQGAWMPSELVAVTTNITYSSGTTGRIKTNDESGNTTNMYVKSGDSSGGVAGDVIIQPGNSGSTHSGNFQAVTGNAGGSVNSGTLELRSGDASAGNSGNINLQSGTSVSGARGDITFNARVVSAASAIVTVKVTADPCGDTAAFPEGAIFYNNTSDYYCFCDGSGNDKQMHSPGTACF